MEESFEQLRSNNPSEQKPENRERATNRGTDNGGTTFPRGFSEAKRQISQNREIKDFLRLFDISAAGKKGEIVEGTIQEYLNPMVGDLERENREWLREKILSLRPYFDEGGITEQDVRESYQRGIEKFFTQIYRLYRNENSPSLALLRTEEFLRDFISGYTYEFIRSLRQAERFKTSPAQALKLAELSNRFNPDILFELKQQFPEFEKSVIQHAAVHNPSNPQKRLEFLRNNKKSV